MSKLFIPTRTMTVDKNNDPKHINNDDLNFYQKHINIKVEAKTLNSILVEANAPKLIDLLSLDTEGYENEVLNGINHDKFKFKYILVEQRILPKRMKF